MTKQIVLFNGTDANIYAGLWVTDGTAQGTRELTGISGAYYAGLSPFDLTAFNGKVLFAGIDATPTHGLWVTDGTRQGTHELTGITGANSSPGLFSGVNPDMTVINSEVLFAGKDTNGQIGLWVTDATSAGTHELNGISGADPSGLLSQAFPDFTVFNGHALFEGSNTSGNLGLWVTDGTASDTHELTGISGAYPSIFNNLGSPDFTVFSGEVFFQGTNAAAYRSLWVTDGTSGGTHEITGISGASSSGLFSGGPSWEPAMTVLNGAMLFSGTNASENRGLWVTDGTGTGTHELTGISGAYSGGIFSGEFTPDMTAFNGKVLFAGRDAAFHEGLWVTDGTAAGTHELTGISGAGVNFGPFDMTVSNGEVLFSADDAVGRIGLWVTDGTAAGTHELNVSGAAWNGLRPSSLISALVDVPPPLPPARNDFDGDGKSDVLLQNTDGTPQVWLMSGTTVASMTNLTNPGSSWHVMASGDFNLDQQADILIQNADGTPQIWLMTGASVASTVTLLNPGPSWHVIATADFNNDGNVDILWQNNDGTPAVWEMNGTSIIGGGVLLNPGSSWHVIGAGDFNGDGNADILWQNTDGAPAIWEMNGTSIIGGGVLLNPGPSWHVIGAGDFDGNGKSDILWQNADGMPAIWEMNGTAITGGGVLLNPGASWHVIGPSDFNGDGLADIVWQNADGTPAIWEMNGTSIIGGGLLPNPGPSWQIKDDGPISPDAASSASPISSAFGLVGVSSLPGAEPSSFNVLHAT